jgi:hypothetical protein
MFGPEYDFLAFIRNASLGLLYLIASGLTDYDV